MFFVKFPSVQTQSFDWNTLNPSKVNLKAHLTLAQIGEHHHYMLRDFFNASVTAPRTALVGVGIETMHLQRMAAVMQLSREPGAADTKVLISTV